MRSVKRERLYRIARALAREAKRTGDWQWAWDEQPLSNLDQIIWGNDCYTVGYNGDYADYDSEADAVDALASSWAQDLDILIADGEITEEEVERAISDALWRWCGTPN